MSNMITKGGARPGAGRPRSAKERTTLQIRINKVDAEIIRQHADFLGLRISSYVESLIKEKEWLHYSHALSRATGEQKKRIINKIKEEQE